MNQWPLCSSRTPNAGYKDYGAYTGMLATESRRIFSSNVVDMETCTLSDLGWVILSWFSARMLIPVLCTGFQPESIQTVQQLQAHL